MGRPAGRIKPILSELRPINPLLLFFAGEKLKNSSPDGIHYLVEFFGCERSQLDSMPFWEKLLIDSISDADVKMLNSHFYQFTPYGVTGYLLLSASHISIHTWPEYEYAACDVFSCGNEEETGKIVAHIRNNLKYKKDRAEKFNRGFRVNSHCRTFPQK